MGFLGGGLGCEVGENGRKEVGCKEVGRKVEELGCEVEEVGREEGCEVGASTGSWARASLAASRKGRREED